MAKKEGEKNPLPISLCVDMKVQWDFFLNIAGASVRNFNNHGQVIKMFPVLKSRIILLILCRILEGVQCLDVRVSVDDTRKICGNMLLSW